MTKLKEFLIEQLSKSHIFEMAQSRSEFIRHVSGGLAYQITENWCLIRYAIISSKNEQLLNHWKTELKTHIFNVTRINIKLDKTRLLNYIFIKQEELTNKDRVYFLISNKWQDEGLEIEDKYTEQVVDDFVNYGVYELVDIIAKGSRNEIIEYVSKGI